MGHRAANLKQFETGYELGGPQQNLVEGLHVFSNIHENLGYDLGSIWGKSNNHCWSVIWKNKVCSLLCNVRQTNHR